MKKNLFVYLLAALTLGGVFTSCSDNDDPTPEPTPKPEVVCPIAETTFNALNGLTLNYSGQPMEGKVVKFSPNASDATKATLELAGENFSFMGSPEKAIAGVIPGEITTTINVDLTIDGDKVSFQGKDEKEGRIIEYKGEATKQSMALNLDVTMPINDFTGKTFSLAEPAKAIAIHWDADKFAFSGGTWEIQGVIGMMMMMVKIEGHTLPECLAAVFSEVTFLPDGNIQAKYKKGLADGEWQTSPINIATYVVKDGKILLYVNPMQIKAITKSTKGLTEVLGDLMGTMGHLLENGVPVSFEEKEGQLAVYLDETVLLPILKQVKPLFEDPAFVEMVMNLLKQKAPAEMASMLPLLKPVLDAFPNIIDTTRDMYFGINMVEKK